MKTEILCIVIHFLSRHSLTNINSTTSALTGGQVCCGHFDGNKSPHTFYFDHTTDSQKWVEGPNLTIARDSHASGMVKDKGTNKMLLVVAGGVDKNGVRLKSTEILMNNQWEIGKNSLVEVKVSKSLDNLSQLLINSCALL